MNKCWQLYQIGLYLYTEIFPIWIDISVISVTFCKFSWKYHVSSPSRPIGWCLISENLSLCFVTTAINWSGMLHGRAHFPITLKIMQKIITPTPLLQYYMSCWGWKKPCTTDIILAEWYFVPAKEFKFTWRAAQALVGAKAKSFSKMYLSPNLSSFAQMAACSTSSSSKS